jgi:hypothetical protein
MTFFANLRGSNQNRVSQGSSPMTHFTDFFTNLRQNLDQAHRDRQRFYRETRAEIQQAAQHLRRDLAEFAADVHNGGKAFRRGG